MRNQVSSLTEQRPPRPSDPDGDLSESGPSAAVQTVEDWQLPTPPTDAERDVYLGPQHRWLPVVSAAGFALIIIGVFLFIGRHPWTFLIAVPLALSLVSSVLSLVTTARKRRVSLASHRLTVGQWQPRTCPSVDVLLPSAGEDLALIANTFRYVADLEWAGRLRVYVLDDSARPEVAEVAESHGFTYLTRPNRGYMKKAGNLLYGYDHSDGDLLTVLDADFVPRPDYLAELVPYFDDPTVGIVQSPQYFDVRRDMNWLQRAAGSTQILFYRYVQPGRDASRASICVGSCAVYRRSALVDAGGFAQIGHSEDVHTGISVMEAGYQIRYVATNVSKGICPDNFDGFVVQQYRWCAGSMALLFSGRFHAVPMTLMQRLCYWSGFTYFMSTALDLLTGVVPTLCMAYFFAANVRPQNYVFVLLALAVRQILVPFITGGGDSLVSLTRIQTTYSFAHLVRLWDLLTRHVDEGWVATGRAKGTSRAKRIVRTARVWLLSLDPPTSLG